MIGWRTAKEKRKLRQRGIQQIRDGKYNVVALKLGWNQDLVLSDLQPAAAVVGASRMGKTRSFFDPAIRNAIDQGWPLIVFDVKGNLTQKTWPLCRFAGL